MAPFLNYSQQFSECSLQQIAQELAGATCLHNLPANDLSVQTLSGPTGVVATRSFEVKFAVDFTGAADAVDARVTVTSHNLTQVGFGSTSPSNCVNTSNSVTTCTLPPFGAGGARLEFTAIFVASQSGPASVDVEVSALNDYEPANNRCHVDLNAAPDARFVLENPNSLFGAVKPGQFFDFEAIVKNTGSMAATGVVAQVRITDLLEFVAIESPAGASCSHDPATFDWFCPVGTVAPGAVLPLKIRLHAVDIPYLQPGSTTGGTIWLTLTAAEPVFQYDNLWAGGVTITPRIADIYVDVTAPASATVNSKVTLTMRVGNHGPDDAEDVRASLRTWTGRGLTFDSATSTRGGCAKDFGGTIACTFSTLASGETIEVTAQATVDSNAGNHDIVGAGGTPLSYDTNRANNERDLLFSSVAAAPAPPASPPPPPTPTPVPVTPQPESGGGGGAGLDLMLLLLLAGSARIARRRKGERELSRFDVQRGEQCEEGEHAQ
jgi:hypothetical protein